MPILSHFATAAANRALAGGGLSRFAGKHLALSAAGKSFVWRIDATGALHPVHPLITPDCEVKFRAGGVHLSGEGEMLKTLSAEWEKVDIPVLLATMVGGGGETPTAASSAALAAVEHLRAALQSTLSRHTASAADSAAYAAAVQDFSHRVDALSRRITATGR